MFLYPKGGDNIENSNLNEIYSELAELIGLEATLIIYAYFKGQQVTFPTRLMSKEYIYKQIKEEYNGQNISELALKYGYTERHLRQIINQKQEVYMSMFKIKIIETLESEVSIEADTLSDAIQKAEARWHNSVYILTGDNFADVTFKSAEFVSS